jgi:uncharacterized OsmC-like protein
VHIRRIDGYKFEVEFAPEAAGRLTTDEGAPLGGGEGPTPNDLVAAAVGNCLAASLVMCLQKSRATIQDLAADVELKVGRNEKGRLRIQGIDVRLRPTLGPDDGPKMDRCRGMFEQFCTVTESVRQGIPVEVTLDTTIAAGSVA